LITRRWNGSQPVKLTVTAQWAEVGWIGGQWQLSIGGYRACVTDRGDAGSGHAWEWELYGNDDHNYWNGWVDSAALVAWLYGAYAVQAVSRLPIYRV
jgi:hypothetical protein